MSSSQKAMTFVVIIPEGHDLHSHHCGNLKGCKIKFLMTVSSVNVLY